MTTATATKKRRRKKPAGTKLKWQKSGRAQVADSMAQIGDLAPGALRWCISPVKPGNLHSVHLSSEELLEEGRDQLSNQYGRLQPFATLTDAKAACQRVEDALLAEAERQSAELPGRQAGTETQSDGGVAGSCWRRPSAKTMLVKIDDIAVVAGANARTDFAEAPLLQLAGSIKRDGLLQPVVINKTPAGLELIAGERRLRAAREAGESHVEARVYDGLDAATAARMRLSENLNRRDLNHVETARALRALADAGMTVAEIAAEVRKSDDYVRKHLDLTRLAPEVADLLADGRLPVKHAELICRVGDPARQRELAEDATRLSWDAKKKAWRGVKRDWMGRTNRRTDEPALDDGDFVLPMEDLRDRVEAVMLSLSKHGWPKGEPYAGRRACEGCPDNTATYADQPTLFAGLAPRGSAKRGHCTNEACYRAKEKAWEKVKAKRKAAAEAKQAERIKKARKAGLDVCAACGKVADADESFDDSKDRKLCPQCLKRYRKASERSGAGHGYDAAQKRMKEMQRKWPWTAEQRFAVALYDYGVAVGRRLHDWALQVPHLPDDAADVALYLVARWDDWTEIGARDLPDPAVFLQGGWEAADLRRCLCRILECSCMNDADQPGVSNWQPAIANVPLSDVALADIALLEALAGHWGVELPARPTAEGVQAEQGVAELAQRIGAIAKKPDGPAKLTELLDGLGDHAPLDAVLADPKLAKWKRAVISEHRTRAAGDPRAAAAEPAAAGEADSAAQGVPPGKRTLYEQQAALVRGGRRRDAVPVIEACEDLELLQEALGAGLTGDWRRAAVRKRIAALGGEPEADQAGQ